MKTTYLLFIIFSGIILVSTLPQNSYACSCVIEEPIENRVDETDIIFSGKLIERIEDIKKKTFIFEIDKLWKNNSDKILLEQKNITIFTASNEAACGTDFTVGLDYLVYADMREKFAYTFFCSGNDLLSLKNIDLEFLSTYNEEPEELPICTSDRAACSEPITCKNTMWNCSNNNNDGIFAWTGTPQGMETEPICTSGDTLVDGVCLVVKIEKTKTVGDDAPFFGIFVYLDDFFSWIFGK